MLRMFNLRHVSTGDFCSQRSSQNVENLQKRAPQFLQNDYTSNGDLLENSNKSTMTNNSKIENTLS